MSLLVWIPMVHGNCKDQGLLGVETSVINTVTYVDGKLGKAAQIGNGNQVTNGISINTNLVEELGTQYSCSVWVKPLGNHVHYEGAIISSGDWNKKNWAFGVNQDNSQVDIFCGGYNRNVACPVPVNQWTHLVSVNDGVYVNLYKNGELVSTTNASSWPLDSDATNTTIGRETYAGGYFSFNGCIQDLRIYNHALSPLEVKRLAQGLVLHYPLNRGGFGGDNIISGTSPNEIQYTYPSSGYSDKFSPITTIVPTASQYTLSFWAKSTVNGDKVTSHYYSPNTTTTCVSNQGISRTASDGNMIFTLSTDWEYYWVTYTQTETTAVKHVIFPRIAAVNNQYNLPCIGSGTISVKCVKFEEGSIPTPWVPNQADALYSQMGLDNNIEYDVSGYGNNGARNGTFSWSGDTPRYNVSTYASGSASTYLSGSTLPAEAKTVSLWIKCNKTVNSAIFSDKTSGLQIGLLNSLLYINSLASTPGFTTTHWVNDEWNHVVAINDNGNRSVYINGQPETQSGASNYYIHNNDNFYLWKRAYNDSYTYNGALSDLRIYATALSADDVMALYKNAGYVDSDGNVYAYEMTE